ncbi:MAG: PKD domain-containing protein [Bacteroidia bacterium]
MKTRLLSFWNGKSLGFLPLPPPKGENLRFAKQYPPLEGPVLLSGGGGLQRPLWLCLAFLFSFTTLQAQVSISADQNSGCAPFVVTFAATAPNATSFQWDLGNGSFSNLPNPGTTYLLGGNYDVILTVGFADGSSQTVTETQFIQVFNSPEVDFTGGPSPVCQDAPVSFTSQVQVGSAAITNYLWDFGDGFSGNQINPTHAYGLGGLFGVTLQVTDINGCSDLLFKANYISVNATPEAEFSADKTVACDPPLTTQFTSLTTQLGLTHAWVLDGAANTSALINPAYTYTANGSYTVSHTVTDALGCTQTVTKAAFVQIGLNAVSIQASDTVICPGDTVQFYCGNLNGTGISWDFGLGGGIVYGCTQEREYATPGLYQVSLSFTDPDGCFYTGTQTIRVSTPATASFLADPNSHCRPPFVTNFINNTVNGFSYVWQFGDGTVGTGFSPTHTYPPSLAANQYDVKLIVTNDDGCITERKVSGAVHTGATIAQPIIDAASGCAPLTVNFNDGSFSTSTISSWQWDLGNGTTGNTPSLSTTYLDSGYYDVTFIVEDILGCKDTFRLDSFIQVGIPIRPDFEVDTIVSCAGDSIRFTNLTPGGDTLNYVWKFGDGENSQAFEPIHFFKDTGFMDITLTAYDRGCADTVRKNNHVYILGPVAEFDIPNQFFCDVPATIPLTDASLDATGWRWDFGDGGIDSVANPTHTFNSSGNYIIRLTARNDSNNCEDVQTKAIQVKGVEASYIPSVTSGCAPLTVTFNNISQNITKSTWDFNAGTAVYLVTSPVFTFTEPGVYDVNLKVESGPLCNDDTTIQITVYKPIASFWPDTTEVCAFETVEFRPSVSSLAPVVNYFWDFGPASLSSPQDTVSYTYTDQGYWDITLIVTDSLGCMDTVFRENYIYAGVPVAGISLADPFNCPDNLIDFNNTSFGTDLIYAWDFGDGNTSTAFAPQHTYTGLGVFPVSLSLVDSLGCDTTSIVPITIAQPLSSIAADTTSIDCPPLPVQFSATNLSGHDFDWLWDFGDGNTSVAQNPTKLYTVAGDYTITMISTAPTGCADTVTLSQQIQIGGPSGDFSFTPDNGCPGTQVAFTAQVNNPAINFQWDLGGGVLTTTPNPVQTYHQAGVYQPLLILRDTGGCEVFLPSSDSLVIFEPPQADYGLSDAVACDSTTIFFADSSSSNVPLTSLFWDFGVFGTSTQSNPSVFYNQLGTYPLTLMVEDSLGCRDTLSVAQQILVAASPNAQFMPSDSVGCMPLGLSFMDQSAAQNASLQNWDWTFGDGAGTSSQQNANYLYQQDGSFTVQLLITDSNGCVDSTTRNIVVNPLPAVDFVGIDSLGCAPQPVQFFVQTPTGVDWEWDFGDGSPLELDEEPMHLYTVDGGYSVNLKVTDANGCVDSLLKPTYIVLARPEADFSLSDSILCPGENLILTDQSNTFWPLVSWDWDFGDGVGTSTQADPTYNYSNAGSYDLRLRIVDSLGCSDELIVPNAVSVLSDLVPAVPEIIAVNVLDKQAIQVRFRAYNNVRDDFKDYTIYRSDDGITFNPVQSLTNVQDTIWLDTTVDTESTDYCYRLMVGNLCDQSSPLTNSQEHCAVWLQSFTDVDQIRLEWTPYLGWDAVDRYEIYRVNNYDPATAVFWTSLPGNQTSFVDTSMFCYDSVTYRIQAFANGAINSWSNIAIEAPQHLGPPIPMHMDLATVTMDSFVYLEWGGVPQGDDLTAVILEKDAGTGFAELLRQSPSDFNRIYQDFDVNVNSQAYQYRISIEDTCGDRSPMGRLATSLHLQVGKNEGQVQLSWNLYEDWAEGVKEYIVEVYNEDNARWELWVSSKTDSLSRAIPDFYQREYCFRVWARGFESWQRSLSNEDCIPAGPIVFVPNAFSPNNDGKNDLFDVQGLFLADFEIQIFNRWGRQVFAAQNAASSWDGMSGGEAVPEGVYIYVIRGIDEYGDTIERNGTVTLVR